MSKPDSEIMPDFTSDSRANALTSAQPALKSAPQDSALAAAVPALDASLSELQTWMVELVRHPRSISKSETLSQSAALHFAGNARVSPAEQINIYRTQFWLRHTNILIEHYPGLTKILGQSAWESVAESYLQDRSNDVFSLSELGHRMALHLQGLPPFEHQELCVEMARLEWAYQQAFVAADHPPLSQQKLAALPPDAWERARFVLSDSVHLLKTHYPVADLRRSLRGDERAALPSETSLQHIVVYRRERTLWDKTISAPAFALLEAFSRGTPLIAACEQIIETTPEAESVFDQQLAAWFSLWGRLGWIVDVHVD